MPGDTPGMRTALYIAGFIILLACLNTALLVLGVDYHAASALSGALLIGGVVYGIYRLVQRSRKPRAVKAPGR